MEHYEELTKTVAEWTKASTKLNHKASVKNDDDYDNQLFQLWLKIDNAIEWKPDSENVTIDITDSELVLLKEAGV